MGTEIMTDPAFWERIAQSAPLVVLLTVLALGIVWRRMVERDKAVDSRFAEIYKEMKEDRGEIYRQMKEDREKDREFRERLIREVLSTVTANTEATRVNTEASREHSRAVKQLSDAIEERRPPH